MARPRKNREIAEPDAGAATAPPVESVEAPASESSASHGGNPPQDRSTAAYWKRILTERPELLERGSNKQLAEIWLADHPGHTEVPKNIIQNLANMKSTLRKAQKEEAGARRKARRTAASNGAAPVARAPEGDLHAYEALEVKIDQCLAFAREADSRAFAQVIQHLRTARNELIRRQAL